MGSPHLTEPLTDLSTARQPTWPSSAMIAGGAIMIAIWPIYTTLHGPTSFNRGGELLGLGPEFWSAMMEGPSLLLMAIGLFGSRALFTIQSSRGARVGMRLAMIGLLIPAIANLAVLAVWPPFLAPLLGAGLILLAGGNALPRRARALLIGMGATQIFAFLWFLVIRPDVLDRIDGYRIYGIVANVLFGLGWILLGLAFMHQRRTVNLGAGAGLGESSGRGR